MNEHYIPYLAWNADCGRYRANPAVGGFCLFDKNNMTNHLHWHEFHEICLVVDGCGKFIHGEDCYELETGDLFAANPLIPHEISSFQSQDLLIYFFSIRIKEGQLPPAETREEQVLECFLQRHNTYTKRNFHLNGYIEFLQCYHRRYREHNFWSHRIMENFIFESLESLAVKKPLPEQPDMSSTESDVLGNAVEFIRKNLRKKLALRDVAAHCCICERSLQLLFRKYLQCTPVDFINEKKAVLAAGYLLQGHRVAEAGAMVGIHDSGQFSRLFKKYFNRPPKAYQQRYLSENIKSLSRHSNASS